MNEMIHNCNQVLEGLKIKAKCINAERHRHLAFFDLVLEYGCRVRKIELFAREIALGLRSKTEPIITTIPEKGIVRLRVALDSSETINFYDLPVERRSGMIPCLLGETDDGSKLWVDLSKHPHTLIAGGTGSGKSTMLHTIIANAIKNNIWLYLSDPKGGVEFGAYDGSVNFLAKTYEETIYMLQSLVKEMDTRNSILADLGINSIEKKPELFSKILVVIDEVADLMIIDSSKQPNKGMFERLIVSLAQKSRASGIYLVIATQRPSVDILKGTIKANFPARIACRVSSSVDSKVILDRAGAESLLGRGDAILYNQDHDYTRFQVAYSTADENVKQI